MLGGNSNVDVLLDGEQDVWLVVCLGFDWSLFGEVGLLCLQLFWGCFECCNVVIIVCKLFVFVVFQWFIEV